MHRPLRIKLLHIQEQVTQRRLDVEVGAEQYGSHVVDDVFFRVFIREMLEELRSEHAGSVGSLGFVIEDQIDDVIPIEILHDPKHGLVRVIVFACGSRVIIDVWRNGNNRETDPSRVH